MLKSSIKKNANRIKTNDPLTTIYIENIPSSTDLKQSFQSFGQIQECGFLENQCGYCQFIDHITTAKVIETFSHAQTGEGFVKIRPITKNALQNIKQIFSCSTKRSSTKYNPKYC